MGFRHWVLAGGLCLLGGELGAREEGYGLQAGLFMPERTVREEMFVGGAGIDLGLFMAQTLDARHELRLELAYGACSDRDANRAQAPWEQHVAGRRPPRAYLDRLSLGVGFRRYLGEGQVRPFVSLGFGASRLNSRVERFVPRDLASCHRHNHHHPEVQPWAEAIKGREPRKLGPQALCGGMESMPLRSTGWRATLTLGAGCLVGERVEVALRHESTPAFGRVLGTWCLSAGLRF